MNSWRTSVQIWPTSVRKRRPFIHSSVLRRVSRAKSWRWVTRRSKMYFMRASSQRELIVWTFSVMFSDVRSFIGGILTREGSMVGCEYSFNLEMLGRLCETQPWRWSSVVTRVRGSKEVNRKNWKNWKRKMRFYVVEESGVSLYRHQCPNRTSNRQIRRGTRWWGLSFSYPSCISLGISIILELERA